MLKIHPIFNSPVEEIFGFKTCCNIRAFDQNLEIQLRNVGDRPVVVPSHFDMEGEQGTKRIETLLPSGMQRIQPKDILAFYCYMEENDWNQATRIVFYDDNGNKYPVEL